MIKRILSFNNVLLHFLIVIITNAFDYNQTESIDWETVDDPIIDGLVFILYTRNKNAEIFNKTTGFKYFNKQRRTKLLIHGFIESTNTSFAIPMLREVFLKVCDCNIIEVDWSKWSVDPYYVQAARKTQPVGRTVGDFLLKLGANLSTTELIGFSMGSHIAGKAGATTNSKIHRIIGLDPAYPLFGNSAPNYRLDPTDAQIVEIVHTGAGFLGFAEPIGLRDFYANGGYHPQPGCSQVNLFCSHRRSFIYYSEALLSEGRGFKTKKCTSFSDYKDGRCKGQPFLALANHNADRTLKGNFYFETNSISPFGKYKNL